MASLVAAAGACAAFCLKDRDEAKEHDARIEKEAAGLAALAEEERLRAAEDSSASKGAALEATRLTRPPVV